MAKSWEDLSPAERLEYLRDAVEELVETVNHNVRANQGQFKKITGRLDALESKVKRA